MWLQDLGDVEYIFQYIGNDLHAQRMREIVSKLALKEWPTEPSESSIFQHCLTWKEFPLFLQYRGIIYH